MNHDVCPNCNASFAKLWVSKEFRIPDSYRGFVCGYCGGWVPVSPYSLGGIVGKWTWKQLQAGL
jgi:hypothetical protein